MRRQGIRGDFVECPDGFVWRRAKEWAPRQEYYLKGVKKIRAGHKRQKRYWHQTGRVNSKGFPINVCLMVWEANCAKCGELFEVRVRWTDKADRAAFKLRHCEAHRLGKKQCAARASAKASLKKHIAFAGVRAEVLELLANGHTPKAVSLTTGCPLPTVYRWRVGQTPTRKREFVLLDEVTTFGIMHSPQRNRRRTFSKGE